MFPVGRCERPEVPSTGDAEPAPVDAAAGTPEGNPRALGLRDDFLDAIRDYFRQIAGQIAPVRQRQRAATPSSTSTGCHVTVPMRTSSASRNFAQARAARNKLQAQWTYR